VLLGRSGGVLGHFVMFSRANTIRHYNKIGTYCRVIGLCHGNSKAIFS